MNRIVMAIKAPILLLSFLLLFSCGKKCKDEDYKKVYVAEVIKQYFGPFKKGSYWIYQNHDKSVTDSLYVFNYSRKLERLVRDCIEEETISFTLKSSKNNLIILDSVCMEAKYSQIETDACYNSSFFNEIYILHGNGDTLSSWDHAVISLNQVNINKEVFTGDLQEINSKSGNKAFYLKKDVGIIGWFTQSDTFNLVNYHLGQ